MTFLVIERDCLLDFRMHECRWNTLWTSIRLTNVYEGHSDLQYQVSATRIYILFLFSCLLIVSIFLQFQNRRSSITVVDVNITQYEFLHEHYSESLSCSCTRSTISYMNFIRGRIFPCDKYLKLTDMDITLLPSLESIKVWIDIDWLLLHIELRNAIRRCELMKSAMLQALIDLSVDSVITLDVVDRSTFYTIINATFINSFDSCAADLSDIYTYLSDVYRVNQFQNQYMTAWTSDFTSNEENFIVRYRPTQWLNGTYCCGIGLSNCSRPLMPLDDSGNRTTFPGLLGGCSATDGVSQSTFECFYDDICLRKLSNVLQLNLTRLDLNDSGYLTNQTIDSFFDRQFKEDFIGSDYSAYFRLCAPSVCQYSYVEKNDALYIFTALLGVYGGLTAALKIIVWYGLSVYRMLIGRSRRVVEPIRHARIS